MKSEDIQQAEVDPVGGGSALGDKAIVEMTRDEILAEIVSLIPTPEEVMPKVRTMPVGFTRKIDVEQRVETLTKKIIGMLQNGVLYDAIERFEYRVAVERKLNQRFGRRGWSIQITEKVRPGWQFCLYVRPKEMEGEL